MRIGSYPRLLARTALERGRGELQQRQPDAARGPLQRSLRVHYVWWGTLFDFDTPYAGAFTLLFRRTT